MKFIKTLFGVLAALWAIAYIPKLLTGIHHMGSSYAFSHMMGSVVGLLLASAISLSFFKSAFKD